MKLQRLKQKMAAISRWHIEKRILQRALHTEPRPDVEAVGEWWFPVTLLNEESVCFCGGIASNINIEVGLATRFGCHVYGFDPTPPAQDYIKSHVALPERFHFIPEGLWSCDEEMTFYLPPNDGVDHVDYSIVVDQGTGRDFTAKCSTIKSLLKRFGHDHLDLLKLNIEGAEYEVLTQMFADGIKPKVLGIAFEGDHAFRKTFEWAGKGGILDQQGYEFVKFWNYTGLFVLRE